MSQRPGNRVRPRFHLLGPADRAQVGSGNTQPLVPAKTLLHPRPMLWCAGTGWYLRKMAKKTHAGSHLLLTCPVPQLSGFLF